MLFHIAADASWSNLPLSGLFVDMLKKILDRAGVVGPAANAQGDGLLPALQNLDGFGTLGAPAAEARALPAKAIGEPPDAEHPPGYYGAAEAPRALNAYAGGQGFRRWMCRASASTCKA